jgi:ElaB/YqjD/DUF883 family membrane-anchored ribosome-binding protein
MEATRKSNHSEVISGLAPVVERVAAGAHDAVDKAASAATKAAKMVDKKSSTALKAMQERYLEGCRDRVREKPLAALGVAVAAGFLVSLLLGRR